MPLEDFERYADAIFPLVSRFEPSVSGEPTMSKGFAKMLGIARRHGVKVDIVTNATLLKDPMIESLVCCAGRIRFSVDAVEAALFEEIREGADFERVLANIKKVMARVEQLPPESRPVTGFICTMMKKNVHQLPRLVTLAHELGLDCVEAGHVQAGTDAIRSQSLAHDPELARRCIDEAAEMACRLGVFLSVNPLQESMAALADSASASLDGLLQARIVNPGKQRPIPAARRNSRRNSKRSPRLLPKRQPPILACSMLWDRTYIHQGGEVRPCCVDGAPLVGNIDDEPFEDVWNNATLRHMRQRLVRRDPVDICKGCQFLLPVDHPREIDRYLAGGSVPGAGDVVEARSGC
jgi:radical SAM protein with 4Fe4S-binding SPASM domain